jgi:hypothetical protein
VQSPSDQDIRLWCAVCSAEDQIADIIGQARAVESMYLEFKHQARARMKQMMLSPQPLYERTERFRIYEHHALPGLSDGCLHASDACLLVRLPRSPKRLAARFKFDLVQSAIVRTGPSGRQSTLARYRRPLVNWDVLQPFVQPSRLVASSGRDGRRQSIKARGRSSLQCPGRVTGLVGGVAVLFPAVGQRGEFAHPLSAVDRALIRLRPVTKREPVGLTPVWSLQ